METRYMKELEKKKKELEEKIKKEKSIKIKKGKKLEFYKFDQNNTGGTHIVNDKLCHRVVIQSYSYEEARQKAMGLGIYFDGCSLGLDCSCCGDRWSDYDEDPIKIKYKEGWRVSLYSNKEEDIEKKWIKLYGDYRILEQPKWTDKDTSFKSYEGKIQFKDINEYCQFHADEYGWTEPDVRLYHYNGKIKEFFKNPAKKKY